LLIEIVVERSPGEDGQFTRRCAPVFSTGIESCGIRPSIPAGSRKTRVIARTSAFLFRGKDQDVRTIGQRRGVGTILEGSVRSAGNRIRITRALRMEEIPPEDARSELLARMPAFVVNMLLDAWAAAIGQPALVTSTVAETTGAKASAVPVARRVRIGKSLMALLPGDRIGPYEVLALLGVGGMGEVYKARDTRLNRVVALKTLSGEKIADAGRRSRFLLEAQAAARLNHPNIVTIYEISEENGVGFIAMEYVPGATLERMNAGAGLRLNDAMKYAADIADALATAHAAGIVHRDLKPANVMVTEDGRTKLLDFGLAQFIQAAPPEDQTATQHTLPGTIVGTAAYMSPEQAEGRTLDARSDIFSFGLVLYEMLGGQRAFRADSWIPRPLRDIRPAIPAAIERHVMRCLSKDPAQRFQTMTDVKRALAEAGSSGGVPEDAPSIAVLPFVNLTAGKENEYFGDGLAEEIINALAKVPELRVIARTSAFLFRGKDQDVRTIGQRLGVGTILEGSVRSAGHRIRIIAQLIRAADESHLWSERYEREMTDIFAIQDDISQAIAHALKVTLAAPRRSTTNVEAFQNYLKGLYWYQRYTPESLALAKESFERVLRQDAACAPAYAGLAVYYYGLGALSIKRMTEMAPLAKSAAESALAIDGTLSEAHSVLGLVAGAVEFDWTAAERHFQAAMAGEPVPPLVRVRYGLYFLTPRGRFEEAAAQYRRALETDPLSMMVHFGLAFALYCQGRYDHAIEHAAAAVDLYPDYWLVHFAMGLALFRKGRLEQSIASLEAAVRLSPSFTLAAGFLASVYVRAGSRGRAAELMEGVSERSPAHYVSPACFAVYHAALGEADKMFECLQAAFSERDPYLTRLDAEPCFEPFRADRRYRDLLSRMNLG
jgi:serine/threonine-protein kinase